jgi:hypothetical protein
LPILKGKRFASWYCFQYSSGRFGAGGTFIGVLILTALVPIGAGYPSLDRRLLSADGAERVKWHQ